MMRKLLSAALAVASIAAGSLVLATPAQASPQVYGPCQKLSQGHVKFYSHQANRVTFATATDQSQSAVLITGCVRSGNSYVQEWQTTGHAGSKGFSPQGKAWEDTWKSPTGSFSFTEALGRSNPGTALKYHTVNPNSRWGGEYGPTYNQYFEGAGGPSDENLYTYMNQGYYEQAAVINWNRQPDMPTVQGASYAIFFHAGNVPSAGCISTHLWAVNQLLRTNRPGDRIIMGSVDDVFSPYSTNQFGSIAYKYNQLGGPAGIGSPTSHETGGLKGYGAYQMFGNGAIVWSPFTGAVYSTGAIRTRWGQYGFEDGWLGYPTADEVYNARTGGASQTFENGVLYWHPSVGVKSSTGAIRGVWGSQGFENGWMGYPTTDEIYNSAKGGVSQGYQNGAIYWHPDAGTFISTGGIRGMWGQHGFENGRLGYPTSNEYPIAGGAVAQNFQGGKITWSPTNGVNIEFK